VRAQPCPREHRALTPPAWENRRGGHLSQSITIAISPRAHRSHYGVILTTRSQTRPADHRDDRCYRQASGAC
jgi:hypothetical protein